MKNFLKNKTQLISSITFIILFLIIIVYPYGNNQKSSNVIEKATTMVVSQETETTIENTTELIPSTENITTTTEEPTTTIKTVTNTTPPPVSGVAELEALNTQKVVTSTNETTVEGIINTANIQDLVNSSIKVNSESELYESMISQLLSGNKTFSYYYPGNYQSNTFVNLLGYESVNHPIKDKEYLLWMLSDGTQKVYLYTGEKVSFSIVVFDISYKVTPEMEKQVDAKVNQAIAACNSGTTVEKIKKVYDYVMNTITYDYSLNNHAVYDALVTGEAVCDAYSLSIYRILSEMGIDCKFVASTDHAWNIVNIEGKWYNLDATWDDNENGITTYQWFLKSNNDFPDHPRIAMYSYPEYPMSPTSYIWK